VPVEGIFVSAVFAIVISVLAACGNADANKTSSKVAARINGDEIWMQSLNSAVSGTPDDLLTAAPGKEPARALERAIDQELLVQKALQAKLDRDPRILREIESAKREILARAYLRQVVPGTPTTSPEEISNFYSRNPALFAERRIYWLQELTATLPEGKVAALQAQSAQAKKLNDVARWLTSQDIPFTTDVSTRAAERIPLGMLRQLSRLNDGQITVYVGPDSVSVVQLMQSQSVPLTKAQARPVIERFLKTRKQLVLIAAELKKLRKKANIEYVGDFRPARTAAVVQPDAVAANPDGLIKLHVGQDMSGL
jgi:EpsD family peptidyl-prolyl cis-trans isomerase